MWRCPATGLAFAQAANVGDCRVAIGRVGVDVAGRRADTARFLTEAHVVETNARERERLERDHGIAVAPGTFRVGGMRTTRALGDSRNPALTFQQGPAWHESNTKPVPDDIFKKIGMEKPATPRRV